MDWDLSIGMMWEFYLCFRTEPPTLCTMKDKLLFYSSAANFLIHCQKSLCFFLSSLVFNSGDLFPPWLPFPSHTRAAIWRATGGRSASKVSLLSCLSLCAWETRVSYLALLPINALLSSGCRRTLSGNFAYLRGTSLCNLGLAPSFLTQYTWALGKALWKIFAGSLEICSVV